MSSAITAPTYDPINTATSLAQKTTGDAQQQLTTQTNAANAAATALTQLGTAISGFQTSLGALAGVGKSLLAQSATLSDSSIASATAQPTAAAGSYKVFVQQVASAAQVTYDKVPDASTANGTLTVTVGSAPPIAIPLAGANTDGGTLSVREIAAAINSASGNTGLVAAGVISVPQADGTTAMRLVLTSKLTGAANGINLAFSGAVDSNLQSALGSPTTSTAGQDAIIWLDAETTGTQVTQASNTFSNIDGVSLTVTRAQAHGDAPVTLTVGNDTAGTTKNVQAFVDAYNKLKTSIDKLLDPGNPASNQSAGAFANDSGIKALQSRMVDLLRPSSGGLSLAVYGITAARDGTLTLDPLRLSKQLATNPTGLDHLMGSASISSPSGVLGSLNTYLNQWSDASKGQIQQRTGANTKLKADLTRRQTSLNDKYDSAYQRYLKQFTDLQSLQATMNSNVSIFDAVFGNDKSSA